MIFTLVQKQPHVYENLLLHYKKGLLMLSFFFSTIFKEIPLWINSQHCRKLLMFKSKFFFLIIKIFLHTSPNPTNFLFNKSLGKSQIPKIQFKVYMPILISLYNRRVYKYCRKADGVQMMNSVDLQVNSLKKHYSFSMFTEYSLTSIDGNKKLCKI